MHQTSSATTSVSRRELPSGRSAIIRLDGREELEVRSPDGAVEVRIELTDSGPVVRLSGARLELDATGDAALSCRRFEVQAEEMRVRTEKDIRLNGATIRLNCTEPE